MRVAFLNNTLIEAGRKEMELRKFSGGIVKSIHFSNVERNKTERFPLKAVKSEIGLPKTRAVLLLLNTAYMQA